MLIDFRSDTVTKPGKEMMEAMMSAKLGDDVFGEDPSINELESFAARMFGMGAGLFCPSGTMTNQVAIRCHTRPGDEVICDESSHIYQYEGGGIAVNSSCSVKLIEGDRGRINAAQVETSINQDDVHKPVSRLVSLENTSNRGGGSCYDLEEIKKIRAVCKKHSLSLHLDGARLFNAIVARKENPVDYGKIFDSISVCLSKGLGCPVGSILLGSAEFIAQGRRIRKVFGGGMRQAGFLAAAGIYALKNNVGRLKVDHEMTRIMAESIKNNAMVEDVLPVETNILIFQVRRPVTADAVVRALKEKGILSYAITPQRVRFVMHLDISEAMVNRTIDIFKDFSIN